MAPISPAPAPPPAASEERSAWTPQLTARAARLFLHEGFSASDVALALGCGLTRGAVISKMKRLGFSKRELTAAAIPAICARPVQALRPIARRLPPEPPPIPMPPLRQIGAQGNATRLATLAEGLCRWPVDDPGPGKMHQTLFCAAPAAGGAYCCAHRGIAGRGRSRGAP